jgi:hypothetical protein
MDNYISKKFTELLNDKTWASMQMGNSAYQCMILKRNDECFFAVSSKDTMVYAGNFHLENNQLILNIEETTFPEEDKITMLNALLLGMKEQNIIQYASNALKKSTIH